MSAEPASSFPNRLGGARAATVRTLQRPSQSFHKRNRDSLEDEQAAGNGRNNLRWSKPADQGSALSPSTRSNIQPGTTDTSDDASTFKKPASTKDREAALPPTLKRPTPEARCMPPPAMLAPLPPPRQQQQQGDRDQSRREPLPLTDIMRRRSSSTRVSTTVAPNAQLVGGPKRRTTIDASEMQALLEELQGAIDVDVEGVEAHCGRRGGGSKRQTVDQETLRQLLEAEKESPNATNTPQARSIRGVLRRRRSSTADIDQILAYLAPPPLPPAGEAAPLPPHPLPPGPTQLVGAISTASTSSTDPALNRVAAQGGSRRPSADPGRRKTVEEPVPLGVGERGEGAAKEKPRHAVNKRLTADLTDLQSLLSEEDGDTAPAPTSTARPGRQRRGTIDPSALLALEDNSYELEHVSMHAVSISAADTTLLPQTAPRRETADPMDLAELAHDAGVEAPVIAGRPPSGKKRAKSDNRKGPAAVAPPPPPSLSAAASASSAGTLGVEASRPSTTSVSPRPRLRVRSPSPKPKQGGQRGSKRRATASPGDVLELLAAMENEEGDVEEKQEPRAEDSPDDPPTPALPSPRKSLKAKGRRPSLLDNLGLTRRGTAAPAEDAARDGPTETEPKGLRSPLSLSASEALPQQQPQQRHPRQTVAASPAPASVTFTMSPPPPPPTTARKGLRSCLSSKKVRGSPAVGSAKKSVVFGSPDARLFYKSLPAINLTPLSKAEVKAYFPERGVDDPAKAPDAAESGVTAQNTAILAAWEEQTNSDEDESQSAGSDRSGSGSSGDRRSRSRSPRPKRRQSVLLPKGLPGFVSYGVREEDEQPTDDDSGNELSPPMSTTARTLNDKLAMAEHEEEGKEDQRAHRSPRATLGLNDGDVEPMDISPIKEGRVFVMEYDDDDMPDIGPRDRQFRTRDERTSFELGMIGGVIPPTRQSTGRRDATAELEPDLGRLVNAVAAPRSATDSISPLLQFPHAAANVDLTDQGATFGMTGTFHPFDGQRMMGNAAKEDRTQELESDLDAMLRQVEERPSPAATAAASRQLQSFGEPPERTMELEANLQAMIGAAAGDAPDQTGPLQLAALRQSTQNILDATLGNDSDAETVEDDEEQDGRRFELSLGSDDGQSSPNGDLETSMLDGASGMEARFELSFMADNASPASSLGGVDPPVVTRAMSITTGPFSEPSDSFMEAERVVDAQENTTGFGSGSKRLRRSLRLSSSSEPSGTPSGDRLDNTGETSPFAHIVVGRLQSVAASSTSHSQTAHESLGYTLATSSTAHSQTGHASLSYSDSSAEQRQQKAAGGAFEVDSASVSLPLPQLAPEGDADCKSAQDGTVATSQHAEETNVVTPQTLQEENEEEQQEKEMPHVDASSGTLLSAFDWAAVSSSIEELHGASVQRVTRVCASGNEGSAPQAGSNTALHHAIHSAIADGAQQMVDGLRSSATSSDEGEAALMTQVFQLQAAVQVILAAIHDPTARVRTANMIREALPELLRAAGEKLASVEVQLAQIARVRATEVLEQGKTRASSVEGVAKDLQGVAHQAEQALEDDRRQRAEEKRRLRVEAARKVWEHAQSRRKAMQAEKDELAQRISSLDASMAQSAAKAQGAQKATLALVRQRKLQERLEALQDKVATLRGVHLVQPREIRSDEVHLAVPHPDGSETQIRLVMEGDVVVCVELTNVQLLKQSRLGPNSRRLLSSLIHSIALFTPVTAKSLPSRSASTSSWTCNILASQIPAALARCERIIGRVNQLVEAVARVEEAYSCSLNLDQEALRKEQWVEACVYGNGCTTCQYSHAPQGEDPTANYSLLLPSTASISTQPLLPQCCGVLNVKLGGNVSLQVLLSLDFLSYTPIKMQPSLRELKLDHETVLRALSPWTSTGFGQHKRSTSDQASVPTAGTAATAGITSLLRACDALQELLGVEQ